MYYLDTIIARLAWIHLCCSIYCFSAVPGVLKHNYLVRMFEKKKGVSKYIFLQRRVLMKILHILTKTGHNIFKIIRMLKKGQ